MYKYLLFDLDETLLDFKKAEAEAITSVFKKHGINSDEETVKMYSAINNSCWKRFEKGEITRDEIYTERFNILGERLEISFNVEKVSECYFATLSKCGPIFPEAFDLLDKLRKKGYVMAAVTNGALVSQTGRIVVSGIAGFFNGGIYISEVVGYKKPQREYFDFVLKALGDPPKDQVLVLGDSVSGDIKGAVGAGLDCCLVNLRGTEPQVDTKPTYTVTALSDIPNICNL